MPLCNTISVDIDVHNKTPTQKNNIFVTEFPLII